MGKKKKIAENSFGNPYFTNLDDYEKLEEEEFEVVKNGVKTIITCKFNKKGYMVSFFSESTKIEPTILLDKKQIKEVNPQLVKERFIKKRG